LNYYNSIEDLELVSGKNIRGKVFCTIPKIGWPTLILKSDKNIDKKKVEF
jgi:signal peptidase I